MIYSHKFNYMKFSDVYSEDDLLYHPKIGVLVKKSLTGHAVAWNDRRQLRREVKRR